MRASNNQTPPEIGQVVSVRQKKFVVTNIQESMLDSQFINDVTLQDTHLVRLSSIEDDDMGSELLVIWEVEPGVSVEEKVKLPSPGRGFDEPDTLDAFMHAVQWGAITTDVNQLQAPFRSGIQPEDYQLEPLIRALQMPRVNLLVADDVGLGKTIEAGLVVQELLFRNRAHSILIVCPAGLQMHWQEQMQDKFGLDFRIIGSDAFAQLRRTRGIHVNPWSHFPRLITSIDFFKRDYPLRLFRELLPSNIDYPREFDILIVDEAHNVSPAGSGNYAVDSLRTQAVSLIAPHFEHRLFLSATPHNGYQESFTSLLAMLDNQRFARGVPPHQDQLEKTMVRRLKSDIVNWDGTPRFPQRRIEPIFVNYTDAEKQAHDLLNQYRSLRLSNPEGKSIADEFVLKLLKKRLFSSPAAFLGTLEVHLQTISKPKSKEIERPKIGELRRAISVTEDTFATDQELDEALVRATTTATRTQRPLSQDEEKVIEQLRHWGITESSRADSKAKELIKWLSKTLKPDGKWNDERVIIFTEYRATQSYLQTILAAHGFTQGDRLKVFYGGMDPEDREHIQNEFQADPSLSPLRILLATDTASEGIDLQKHCHRLIHYEIPWNPNRMEQRNGRIDRYGQKYEPELYHFVGKKPEEIKPGAASLDDDLEFLWVAVNKVNNIRQDLGSVGPVIASSIEEAMLGRTRILDTSIAEMKAQQLRRYTRFQADQKERIRKARELQIKSQNDLNLTPDNVHKVVETALILAEKPPLIPAMDILGLDGKAYYLPELTGSWEKCTVGLSHPFTGRVRPIVFDAALAKDRDDVVLAHLNHPLVQMSLRLLRAEIWSPETERGLNRVTIRVVPDNLLDTPAAMAYGRLVLLGGDNQRLNEEIISAGGEIREGVFRRIPQVGRVTQLLNQSQAKTISKNIKISLQQVWENIEPNLMLALEARVKQRIDGLQRELTNNEEKECEDITAILSDLASSIEKELSEEAPVQLELWNDEERDQLRRDEEALRFRLKQIPGELENELERIRTHYSNPQPRMYPVSVIFLIPEHMWEI